MLNYKNILILSPHTDDSELGCGGFISKFSPIANITIFVFCAPFIPNNNKHILLEEFKTAAKLQKVNKRIFNFPVRNFYKDRQTILEILYKEKNNYDLVLCPCSLDTHQDHKVIYRETIRAFKNTTMLGYELPWNHININSPFFIKLSKSDIGAKWKAISCYKSQIKLKRSYFKKEFIYSQAKVRGVQCGNNYAELFEAIKIIT